MLASRRVTPMVCRISRICALTAPWILAGSLAAQSGASAVLTQTVLTPFQQKAWYAFSPTGTSVSQVTMTGTVTRTAGSLHESGAVTLRSGRDGSWSEDWSGVRDERRITCKSWQEGRTCALASGSKESEIEGVTNQRSVPWFAPWWALSQVRDQTVAVVENAADVANPVLSLTPTFSLAPDTPGETLKQFAEIAKSANVAVLFDGVTGLASGLRFSEPLSNDTSNAIDISITFGDYRLENGMMVPHHIQRYVQRTLESDIQITNVAIN